ncbi:MAG: tetratricopeptide repeat protein [Pyrinomonadaceae bacterium]
MPVTILNSRGKQGRIALIGVILAALVFAWFAVRWQVGNMLGELTPPAQVNAMEIARAAVTLAPGDPRARWLVAAKMKETFDSESIEGSVRELEEVVRLSPNDYRWWIELGRAYEQAEKPEDAERALQRAVDLAPAYTFPHWQIGNFYLRQDRSDEAFAELTKTTEKSIVYREQVFALAWDYFEKDPAKVEQIAANTPDVRASLSMFYAQRGAPADSLRVWNSLPPDEKARHPEILKIITQSLYAKRFYRQTLEFSKQSGIDPEAAFETVGNGGFEKFIGDSETTLFGWRINRSDAKLDIITDSAVKTEGVKSLKLNFRAYSKLELYNVFQLVAVEPSARYSLSFMLRTENLRSGGEPLIEIVDANSDAVIAATPRFPLGSNDWQKITVDFLVPQTCEGITIRTTRIQCGENCPIAGTIWYDDFKISRVQ